MSEKAAIYLDANAAAPLKAEVLEALSGVLKTESIGFPSNPSSVHSHGRSARRFLFEARQQVALSLGSQVFLDELIFTSSGTESNQLALRLALESRLLRGEKPHWILSAAEHDSLVQMRAWLEERGGKVSELPLDAEGRPRVAELDRLWRPETALVSLIWVNNETGVITDIAEASAQVRARGGLLHLDAAQAWGKLPLDARTSGADLLALSGHKIGAPAGTGALWVSRAFAVRNGRPVPAIVGKQEQGRRGGTENLLGAIGLGAAAAALDPRSWATRVGASRDRLEREIVERVPGARINGRGAARVANTINLNFEGVKQDGLVLALDLAGYSVSSGAACSSGVAEPSRVLLAMGRSESEARAALRISLADELPWETMEGFLTALAASVARLRGRGGA
ncbi:MAG: cysteine desulfurase [Oligoflexia bacterium]|nr:cysteine desulfurase [Oligoflexia bacterium]